jgi:predicted TIM-barrel fold metal-dependent hydrolase
MGIVDAHVHLYSPEANRDPIAWGLGKGERSWVEMCTRRRKSGLPVQEFPTVDELLLEMDGAGVERGVLLGWYWASAETCAAQNRFYAECVQAHPDRLSAFATFQPAAGSSTAQEELQRTRNEGFVGIGELSPHSQGYGVANATFRELLQQAAEWKWPVNLHVTDPNCRDYPGRVETPLTDFVQLAQTCPDVTFILAHWGGLLPLRETSAQALTNVCYDTAASPLLYDATVWARFFATVPEDRILFGSDYPLNLFPKQDARAGMKRFVAEAKLAGAGSLVLRENIRRLVQM